MEAGALTQLQETLSSLRTVKGTFKRLYRVLSSASKDVSETGNKGHAVKDTVYQGLCFTLDKRIQDICDTLKTESETMLTAYKALKECVGQVKQAYQLSAQCTNFAKRYTGQGKKPGLLLCWQGGAAGGQSTEELESINQLVRGRVQANRSVLEHCLDTARQVIGVHDCPTVDRNSAKPSNPTPHFHTPPRPIIRRPALLNSQVSSDDTSDTSTTSLFTAGQARHYRNFSLNG